MRPVRALRQTWKCGRFAAIANFDYAAGRALSIGKRHEHIRLGIRTCASARARARRGGDGAPAGGSRGGCLPRCGRRGRSLRSRDELSRTKADLTPLATRAELASLESRLTWRMVAIVAVINGAYTALIVGLLVAVLDRLP